MVGLSHCSSCSFVLKEKPQIILKKEEQRLNESQGQGDQDSPLVPTVAVTDRLRDIATPQQQRHDERLFPNQRQVIPFIDWSGNGLHWSSSFLVLTHTDTHLYPGGKSNLTLPLGTAIHAQSFYKDATSATILGISILPEDTCDGGWAGGLGARNWMTGMTAAKSRLSAHTRIWE